jgi:hypothetical protein
MDPLGKLYCCENTWDLILEFKGGMEVLDLWERMMNLIPEVGHLPEVYTYDQLRENLQHSHMILCQIMTVATICPDDYSYRGQMNVLFWSLMRVSEHCGTTYILTTKQPIRAKIIEAVYSFTLRELKMEVGEKWCYCETATVLPNPEAVFAEDLEYVASGMVKDFQVMTPTTPTTKVMETQLLSLQEEPIIPTMALTFVMGLDHHTLADELFGFMNDYILSGAYRMSHRVRLQIETMVLKVDGTHWVSLIDAGHQVMKFMNEFFSDDTRWDKLYKWWSVSGLA